MLRFRTTAGREIIYCAMQDPAFVAFTDAEQMYAWMQSCLQTDDDRIRFGLQFLRPEHYDLLLRADLKHRWASARRPMSSAWLPASLNPITPVALDCKNGQ